MVKRYVVLGNWFDKETGKPKSSLGEINEGINKNGKSYQLVNTDSTMIYDGTYAVGTIMSCPITLTPETQTKASSTN